MRKLATVRKIDNIAPIPNADAIEVASIGGWAVVVKKNEYNIGDIVIYCEIDSWIPTELAPFLTKTVEPREYNGVKGERLRTVRLRGQISQGLILPFTKDMAIKIGADPETKFDDCVGVDLSEVLNIQKYEATISAQLSGEVVGNFPAIIPKTDQERIQNLSSDINEWNDLLFEETEKLDGSSCTYFLDSEKNFHVCSRNLDLRRNYDNSLWKVMQRYDLETKMIEKNLTNIAIQGELIGEGIQGNKYGIKGQDFYVFDIYDANQGRYFNSQERTQLCIELGLMHCPVLGTTSVNGMSVNDFLQRAEGKSVLNIKAEREGIVFKCVTDPSIHFKSISNRFLIKNNE